MTRTLKTTALAFALIVTAAPAFATILTLPFIGDIEHPDLDPIHVLNPDTPAAAPATAASAPKKHHHHKMKKKM